LSSLLDTHFFSFELLGFFLFPVWICYIYSFVQDITIYSFVQDIAFLKTHFFCSDRLLRRLYVGGSIMYRERVGSAVRRTHHPMLCCLGYRLIILSRELNRLSEKQELKL